MKTPNNFEEKLIKIRDELLTKVTEGIQLGEYILEALALDDFNEAISTLCEEEIKRTIDKIKDNLPQVLPNGWIDLKETPVVFVDKPPKEIKLRTADYMDGYKNALGDVKNSIEYVEKGE